ncbi:MAG: TonB-dependent receptor [Halieaceae bacterium]|jgi:iron complex outermembrane receptor protein|nr:TonB-dependent receptor [Halieaceae bacterium]
MSRNAPHFRRSLIAASISAAVSSTAFAQGDPQIEEVLITGSFIKGTSENEASPVEVLDSGFIQQTGAVTIAELTARLAVASGSENNPDSFTAGETQGTSNVNLRGLGLTSTLVLINGKRQTVAAAVANDGSVFVDTNTVPQAALERVEVLKEGATATYGSDAIAGVVNFITRENFEGFEVSGGYQTTTESSQGTTDVNFVGGMNFGSSSNLLLSGTFRQQDPLSSAERPFTTENAISTLGRSFVAIAPTTGTGAYAGTYSPGQNIPDPACLDSPLGVIVPQPSGSRCGFLYGPRFNLVNDEEQTQLYGNFSHDFSDDLAMTIELGWTKNEVFDNPQSPTYPNLSFPLILPGQGGSPFDQPVVWLGRPLGAEAPSPFAPRDSETLRASIDFEGSLNSGWDWYAALTYSENDRTAVQPDTITSRLNDGIAGVGGPNGNLTFNVFDPTQNSQEIIDYIYGEQISNRTTDLLVGDVVFSGDLFDMDAGSVGVAFGAQFRQEGYQINFNDIATQAPATTEEGFPPPIDLTFLGGGRPIDESRTSYALFAEASIPLTSSIEVNVAGRYEDLETASSFDPKVAVRWQATDSFVLRASASSAFREPSLQQFFSQETALEGLVDPLNPGGALFVRVDTAGSLDLQPESSTNFNLGGIWNPTDDITLRVDYWRFDYEDVIVAESAQGKLLADPSSPDINRSATGQLAGVRTNYINASTVETDGIDVSVDWFVPTDGFGQFGLNVTATHFLSYEIPCTAANNRGCSGPGGTEDVAGFFNFDTFVRSIPETKINGVLDWTMGNHSLALLGFYTSSYETTRAVDARAASLGYTGDIDSWFTMDLQYAYNFAFGDNNATLTLGSKNVFDELPPRVYDAANFSYDPKHHDPRGRMVYARVKVNF